MHSFAHGETIVIYHRTPREIAGVKQYDTFGNVLYDEVAETVLGATVWPHVFLRRDLEVAQNQDRTTMTYTLALPDDNIVVLPVDRIVWRGRSYEVRGEMEQSTNMVTGTHCNTVSMNRVEG